MAAARKSCNYLYFGSVEKVINPNTTNDQFNFDESDVVWSSSSESKKPTLPFPSKKGSNVNQIIIPVSGTSLPVNVPDWSRILGNEYKGGQQKEEEDDENGWLPPHEYLARTRGSSFSVHEGFGRTLKGRDMSRVRNAVWKKIGFED